MKTVFVILHVLFVVCYLPVYSALKKTTAVQESVLTEISSLKELENILKSANKKMVFIDFYSDFCPPCRQFKPLYESWARLFGGEILFIMVDTGKSETSGLCKKFEISGLPTLVVLDSKGEKIDKHVGMEEIKKIDVGSFLAQVKEIEQSI